MTTKPTEYEIARGTAAITGSGTVQTGLQVVKNVTVSLSDDASLQATHVTVAKTSVRGQIQIKVWKPTASNDVTPVAATVAKNVEWIAVGY